MLDGQGGRVGIAFPEPDRLLTEPSLALMPDREDQYRVVLGFVAVEGHITGPAAGNDQFAKLIVHGTANQGMAFQDRHRLRDQFHGLAGSNRVGVNQKVGKAIEIGKSARGIDQARHERALGLAALVPATLAFR